MTDFNSAGADQAAASTGPSGSSIAAGAAAALALSAATGAARAATTAFQVGAGKAAIALPVPVGGFATIIDPLYVRVLVLENGATQIALLSIDLTALDPNLMAGWGAQVAGIVGCAAANVLVYASHNFSSPHVNAPGSPGDTTANDNAVTAITAAVQVAAKAAVANLVPARSGHGTGRSKLAVNRDELGSGGWWTGFNDTEFSDPRFSVMRFDNSAGAPIALLVNVNVQPSVLDSVLDANGAPVISADLAGQVVTRLESHYGSGVTALFMPGAGGDQAPVFKGSFNIFPPGVNFLTITQSQDQGVSLLNQIGGRLNADVVRVVDRIVTTVPGRLSLNSSSVSLTSMSQPPQPTPEPKLTWSYTPYYGAAVSLTWYTVVVGDAVIVGTAPELYAILGYTIRELSPFKATLIGTLLNGSAKYLPDQQGYDRFTYEALEARYAPGSGEIFVEAVAANLHAIHRG